MFERRIAESDVRRILEAGETIATYPDDQPYPSRLVFGFAEDRPLHVVVAENAESNKMIVITVYEPDPETWDTTFRRRTR